MISGGEGVFSSGVEEAEKIAVCGCNYEKDKIIQYTTQSKRFLSHLFLTQFNLSQCFSHNLSGFLQHYQDVQTNMLALVL